MEKKFETNSVVSQLRNAYGIRKVFSWARPWICPFDKLISQVPENKSIFDVGCGNGVFLYLLAFFRKPKKLYGIDIFDNNLDVVKKIFPNVQYKKINKISDWPNTNFDVVTVIDVLHHIKPQEQLDFLNKVYDKIKPGGLLIIKDMSKKPWYFAMMNIIHDLIFAKQLIHYLPFHELVLNIKLNGFEIKEINSKILFWYSHEWIVAKKTIY